MKSEEGRLNQNFIISPSDFSPHTFFGLYG